MRRPATIVQAHFSLSVAGGCAISRGSRMRLCAAQLKTNSQSTFSRPRNLTCRSEPFASAIRSSSPPASAGSGQQTSETTGCSRSARPAAAPSAPSRTPATTRLEECTPAQSTDGQSRHTAHRTPRTIHADASTSILLLPRAMRAIGAICERGGRGCLGICRWWFGLGGYGSQRGAIRRWPGRWGRAVEAASGL